MVEIVNIVGSGDLETELDLEAIVEHAGLENFDGISSVELSRNRGQRLFVRFDDTPLGILSRSGTYIITGAKSYDSLYSDRDNLLEALRGSEVAPDANADNFDIQNVVCVGEMEESKLDLSEIAVILGIEDVEYEPEQFPGLVYRPDDSSCCMLIFNSGKTVITGLSNEDLASEEFEKVHNTIREYV